ncbi:MAG: hypothetical protein JW783_15725 [Bacteroidales bacterium]|nr:hypothetical protein [Bacteroidales bacterium]MBN2748008.1 hypothetical protein [Bacteroidales bacterium]
MDYIATIEKDIAWLSVIIEERVKQKNFNFDLIKPDDLKKDSVYSDFIVENKISNEERLLLILTLVPHIYPTYLHEKFNANYLNPDDSSSMYFIKCPEYHSAIIKSPSSNSFLPTGQTFLYLVAGENLEKRVFYTKCVFEKQFHTISQNVIYPIQNNVFDPLLGNIISLNHNYALAFLTNSTELINFK